MARKPAKQTQSKPDSKPKSGRGGKRAGAGRKTAEATQARADFNAATISTIGPWLAQILGNLKKLADGGYERVERKFEVDPVTGLEVLVERKVEIAEPDRAANIYLADRLLGRPKQAVEHSGEDGQPIPIAVISALDKAYAEDRCDAS